MANFFFLYHLSDGSHYTHYLGNTDEWTNVPDGCGVIGPLPDTDKTAMDAFKNPNRYIVQNSALVMNATDQEILDSEKQKQKNQVLSDYQKAQDTTVQSSALGTPYTYVLGGNAKTRYDAIYARFHNDSTYTQEDIYTVEDGYLTHTKDQFTQFWEDAFSNDKALDQKYRQKVSDINAVQLANYSTLQDAINAVQAVVWS